MVEIKDFSLSYPNGEKVLRDFSLHVKQGECVLLTGESGSGKSSIINSINGLAVRYDNCSYVGEVKIGGKDIKEMELYEISMLVSSVFQNPKTHFFNVDTTLELLFYLENIGLRREEMERRMKEMLAIFPIEGLLNRNIFDLSGGEKQILSIATTYISGTKLIVLDEPSSNLDEKHTEVIAGMLKKLKEAGVTLLVAEHRIYYLMDLVDRILFLKEGRLEKEYLREEFLSLEDKELEEKGIRTRRKEELRISKIGRGNGILIKEIQYFFPKTKSGILVQDIFLEKGKIYGVIGKNGIGKSTFIKNLIGVLKGKKDEVFLYDRRMKRGKRLKKSALVMQDVNHQLFSDSVEEEICLGLDGIGEEKIGVVLEKLGLRELRKKHPMSLSGGQKQRVAIASVILAEREFVCFDEPTSGMDYRNMVAISDLIRQTMGKESIILIISHDTEFLNRTADYVIDVEEFSLKG